MFLPDRDTFFQSRGDYEIRDYNFAMQHVKQRRVAIDVGAHCGYWSKRFCDHFDTVVAFEPVTEHHECLVANTNHANNITIHNVCVGANTDPVYMQVATHNSGMSKVSNTPTDAHTACVTLDNALSELEHCDIIKIDVEGWEAQVLLGARKVIAKHKPIIFLEIWDRERATTPVPGILTDMGYVLIGQIDENYIFKFWPDNSIEKHNE